MMMVGLDRLSYKERLRKLRLFSIRQRGLREGLISAYKYLLGDVKKTETGAFRQYLMTGEVQIEIREILLKHKTKKLL